VDVISVTALAFSALAAILGALSRIALSSEKTARYGEVLRGVERLISGKPLSTRPLETQLDEAVEQLTTASARVGGILSEVQADVERRRKEATNLRSLIEELKKEYEDNKSLANLTAEQASAVRQVLSREVAVLKRRSYLPDILINLSVGALFFVLGILVTTYLGK